MEKISFIVCLNDEEKDLKLFSITLESEILEQNILNQVYNVTNIDFVGLKRFTNKQQFPNGRMLQKINIPDTCENYGESQTFISCHSVKEIKLSNNSLCTVIPNRFASNICDYVELYIPNNYTTVGYGAFGGGDETKKLKRIYMGTGITNIDDLAFASSYNLEEVTIKAVTPPTLHQDAFKECSDTFKIYVPSESVEAYKTASVWSNYADRIFGIEEETN